LLCIIVIGLGLLSRTAIIPEIIYPYLGDILYALLVYLLWAFLFPKASSKKIVILTLLSCFGIELSQLYHAPWIDAIRNTRLGALTLGFGFLWTDLLAYTAGAAIGYILEFYYLKIKV